MESENRNLEPYLATIGCGNWGKNLVRVFYKLGVLGTVCDTDLATLSSIKELYPQIETAANYDAILADSRIKAVAIASPAITHYELAKKTLLAGKDVFVEKPLAMKIEEAKELIKIAKEKDRILMVGHLLHYHPAVIKLKQIIEAGELGKIQYIYSNRLNIGKLRTEENILWSFAPHDISAMLMLLDEDPLCVTAFGEGYITNGVYDTTLTTLEFKDRVKGHIFVSWLHPYKEQKLIVVGTKSMAVFDDLSREKLFVYPHKIEYKNGKIPVAQKAEYYVVSVEEKEPLKEELEHFLMCIKERESPRTDGEEGLRVLEVLTLAQDSLGVLADKKVLVHPANQEYFVHETAIIDENVEIGEGTKVWHFSHILQNTKIGQNCSFGQNVMVGPNVNIGNNCKIQNNISIYEGVTLEDYVFCGPSMVFTNIIDPRSKYPQRGSEFYRKTLIKEGASIGANATIVCGHTIGRHAFIGAGALVTKDIPDYALMVGVPAKQVGWVCECGIKRLEFDSNNEAVCGRCGVRYKLANNILAKI